MSWIDIVVIICVALILGGIAARRISSRKKGKSAFGCEGCSGCPSASQCASHVQPK